MSAKRLIVVGASAGGIEALRELVAHLPPSLPAATCVVLHTSSQSPGILPDILSRAASLPVTHARNRERLNAGHVYIAPPDFHLMVEPGLMRVTRGPREHGFRPAIDPLFRSAAQVFGPAAIGVVLTGNLDDGTAGLWTIKQLGGIAIVQDPEDALFPEMPLHASNRVRVDFQVPLARIAPLLNELTTEVVRHDPVPPVPEHIDVEVNIAKEHEPRSAGLERLGRPSAFSCPDCGGVLLELRQEDRVRFRCHIGHAYSLDSLLAAITQRIELEVEVAIRSLAEGSLLMDDIASQLRGHHDDAAARMAVAADRLRRQSLGIRELMRESVVVDTPPD